MNANLHMLLMAATAVPAAFFVFGIIRAALPKAENAPAYGALLGFLIVSSVASGSAISAKVVVFGASLLILGAIWCYLSCMGLRRPWARTISSIVGVVIIFRLLDMAF